MSPSQRDIYAKTMAVFEACEDAHDPLTTPEVATALDANRRTVYKRLQTLVDRDSLETIATGSNSRVWWPPQSDSPQSTQGGSGTDLASGPNVDHVPGTEQFLD